MKTRYLFPFKYKFIGWILLLIGLIFGVVSIVDDFEELNWTMKVFALFNDGFIGDTNDNFSWFEDNIFNELT